MATVERIRMRFVKPGLETPLVRKPLERPSRLKTLDGRGQANLAEAPAGQNAGTVRFPADKFDELAVVWAICDETVPRSMKTRNEASAE